MPLVITDSSILIGLAQVGHLPLLPGLFDEVVAPSAVVAEFGHRPDWLREVPVADYTRVTAHRAHLLDEGQAEAMALARDGRDAPDGRAEGPPIRALLYPSSVREASWFEPNNGALSPKCVACSTTYAPSDSGSLIPCTRSFSPWQGNPTGGGTALKLNVRCDAAFSNAIGANTNKTLLREWDDSFRA